MADGRLSTQGRIARSGLTIAAAFAISGVARADEPFPTSAKSALAFTFTASTPAMPIDVGGDTDLTVDRYLTTTVNDANKGFLDPTAGRCVNIRFTDRKAQTIGSKGYCKFKDKDGGAHNAEYTADGAKPIKAITLSWTFQAGSGNYDGISGTAKA